MKELIRTHINDVIRKIASDFRGNFTVEVSDSPEHGDYSTNVALVLAKSLHKNSIEVAQEFSEVLLKQLSGWKVEIAGPGFINFGIPEKTLGKELCSILQKKEKYGRVPKTKIKVQVEFISANPTGPLTLANGRGGFLGDALSNIFEFSGYQVEREYYVNDAGNQIFILGKSMLAAVGMAEQEENLYKADYIKKWAKSRKAFLNKFRNDPLKIGDRAAKDFFVLIRRVVQKKAKIQIDRFTSEKRHIRQKNFIKKVLAIFERSEDSYKKEGAVWLKTTKYGDDKDRVLITSDGHPTYFLVDGGHYLETKKRGFKIKINILGPDHHGYVKRIQAVARMMGLENSQIIVTQAVRLLRRGKEVKISKRKGEFITFEKVIDEVGLDAARFFFLEKSSTTHMDFDLDLAKEKSLKNPVYYIQYAYVRCFSILSKVRSAGRGVRSVSYELLKEKEELILIKKLIRFPEVLEDTTKDYHVHRLTRYLLELAKVFHNFYEKHQVITKDGTLTNARLELVRATEIVLRKSFRLLGIASPKSM